MNNICQATKEKVNYFNQWVDLKIKRGFPNKLFVHKQDYSIIDLKNPQAYYLQIDILKHLCNIQRDLWNKSGKSWGQNEKARKVSYKAKCWPVCSLIC